MKLTILFVALMALLTCFNSDLDSVTAIFRKKWGGHHGGFHRGHGWGGGHHFKKFGGYGGGGFHKFGGFGKFKKWG